MVEIIVIVSNKGEKAIIPWNTSRKQSSSDTNVSFCGSKSRQYKEEPVLEFCYKTNDIIEKLYYISINELPLFQFFLYHPLTQVILFFKELYVNAHSSGLQSFSLCSACTISWPVLHPCIFWEEAMLKGKAQRVCFSVANRFLFLNSYSWLNRFMNQKLNTKNSTWKLQWWSQM